MDPSEIYHTGTLAQIHPAPAHAGGMPGAAQRAHRQQQARQRGGKGSGRRSGLGGGSSTGRSFSDGDGLLQPMQVFLTLHRRIDFKSVVSGGPPMLADVSHWEKAPSPGVGGEEGLLSLEHDGTLLKALSNEVVAVIRDLVKMNPLFREQTQFFTTR